MIENRRDIDNKIALITGVLPEEVSSKTDYEIIFEIGYREGFMASFQRDIDNNDPNNVKFITLKAIVGLLRIHNFDEAVELIRSYVRGDNEALKEIFKKKEY